MFRARFMMILFSVALASLSIGCTIDFDDTCSIDSDCSEGDFCDRTLPDPSKWYCVPGERETPEGDGGLGGAGGFGGAGGDIGGCVPSDEVCDGEDNDCDGNVDEGFYVGTPCTLGQGLCSAEGEFVCNQDQDAVECNARQISPRVEQCDGEDNDCDGRVDEDARGVGDPCAVGLGLCAQTSRNVCRNGELICPAEAKSPQDIAEHELEIRKCNESGQDPDCMCDGVDSDCDGRVDEAVQNENEFKTCGFGPCQISYRACAPEPDECRNGGNLANRSPEVCDGVDNDCDDETDETFPDEGGACEYTSEGCPFDLPGTLVCVGGSEGCIQSPLEDSCNGIDDDCDGDVDEDYAPTPCERGVGACYAEGMNVCDNGSVVCNAEVIDPIPLPNPCDNIDNDCDGTVDETIDQLNSDGQGPEDLCDFQCINNGNGTETCLFTHNVTRNAAAAALILLAAIIDEATFYIVGCEQPTVNDRDGNIIPENDDRLGHAPVTCISDTGRQQWLRAMQRVYHNWTVSWPTRADLIRFNPVGAGVPVGAHGLDPNFAAVGGPTPVCTVHRNERGICDIAGDVRETVICAANPELLCTAGAQYGGRNEARIRLQNEGGNINGGNEQPTTGIRLLITRPRP